MDIVETFQNHFGSGNASTHDFTLVEYRPNFFIGIDKFDHVCVVVKSSGLHRFPIKYKTQKISIECNMKVCYELNGKPYDDTVHIIRCLSEVKREKYIFLELSMVLIQEGDKSEEAIIETFNILRTFFNDKKELSDNELIGLYAELYTICSFHESLEIEKYWQSRDRMKFDFSISEKVKLEVKATVKNIRTHHFRHEQLMTEVYDIFVLSYLLRYDDEGLSLFELLMSCKKIMANDSRKLLRINYVLKNVEESRLKHLRFNRAYTEANRHIYRAADIPKFRENTPRGVANAEYDCVLDNVEFIEDDLFIDIVKSNSVGAQNV